MSFFSEAVRARSRIAHRRISADGAGRTAGVSECCVQRAAPRRARHIMIYIFAKVVWLYYSEQNY